MIRDQFWDDVFPELPYTAAAEETRIEPIIGGAANVEVGCHISTQVISTKGELEEVFYFIRYQMRTSFL